MAAISQQFHLSLNMIIKKSQLKPDVESLSSYMLKRIVSKLLAIV